MYALSTKTTDKTRNDNQFRNQALHQRMSHPSCKSGVDEDTQTTSRPSVDALIWCGLIFGGI